MTSTQQTQEIAILKSARKPLTLKLNSDTIISADRDTDFLLLQQPQSRFEILNRISVSNRNVAFLLGDIMPRGIYKKSEEQLKKMKEFGFQKGHKPLRHRKIWRKKSPQGYVYIFKKGGFKAEHRLVMERILKRQLSKWEQVHHINGIRDDNRPENLYLVIIQKNWHPKTCPKCGFEFSIK